MDASVNRIKSTDNERAYLLAIKLPGQKTGPVEYSLQELVLLIKTAGAILAEKRIVSRKQIDASFVVGKGFVSDIKNEIQEKEITLLVFDMNELRPAQVRNLEEELKCRVVGRNEIILDIFARRARSAEAKAQVELAQLQYILPRLKGLGGVLSRLGGGIGTRGPGEKMLETDRRHIQKRIQALRGRLSKLEAHRQRTRQGRMDRFTVAVAGYTNAGKSSLVNRLAGDDLFVENRLFATLDAYTRRVYIDETKQALLTDTVGFIRNLPASLIEAFRSTLEEITHASAILHVVDITSPDIYGNIATVDEEILALEAQDIPQILFFNKTDLLEDDRVINEMLLHHPRALFGSVKSGDGLDALIDRLGELYDREL